MDISEEVPDVDLRRRRPGATVWRRFVNVYGHGLDDTTQALLAALAGTLATWPHTTSALRPPTS
jgi:hypothetical protein